MPRLAGPLAGLVALILAAGAGFVGLSDRVFPFTESLQREDSLNEEVHEQRSNVSLRFHSDDESVTVSSEVSINEAGDGLYDLRVTTSHSEDMCLDSLRLIINAGNQPPNIALRTPGGFPWEPIHFQRTDDGQGVVVDVPDLGIQGTGTVSLEFLMGPYHSADDVPETLWLNFNARAHETVGLQLTAYEADALVEVPIPEGGSINKDSSD